METQTKQIDDAAEQATRQEQFESIPPDRIFATLHLYLDPDNEIVGFVHYQGPKLGVLGVSDSKARECRDAARFLQPAAQSAIGKASAVATITELACAIMSAREEGTDDGSQN